MENSVEVSQKIKNGSAIWSSYLIAECISKRNKNKILEISSLQCLCNIIHNNQDMETEYVPVNGWMDK